MGLAELIKAAGFTQGGFYNHFKSKDSLVAAPRSSIGWKPILMSWPSPSAPSQIQLFRSRTFQFMRCDSIIGCVFRTTLNLLIDQFLERSLQILPGGQSRNYPQCAFSFLRTCTLP